jgi:hypothetical protein
MHKEIDRYNECFLFERVVPGASYSYLELLPESRLHESEVMHGRNCLRGGGSD